MLPTPFAKYLHTLNTNDDALKAFLADPIGQSEKANLSKAERSVLRRVVAAGSNGSKNGYSIVKPLAGYRQAIQLMQNVMHNSMGAALATAAGQGSRTLIIYPPNGSYPFYFTGTGDTIGELMDNVQATYSGQFSYANDTSFQVPIVGSITVGGSTYNNPPGSTPGIPFWFWSTNGLANPSANNYGSGTSAEKSYYYHAIGPDIYTVVWQVIAPTQRGFPSCFPTDGKHADGLA